MTNLPRHQNRKNPLRPPPKHPNGPNAARMKSVSEAYKCYQIDKYAEEQEQIRNRLSRYVDAVWKIRL